MIRALRIAGIVLAVLVLVTAGTAVWLVGTQAGSRLALQQAQNRLPPGIDLGTISGRLADDLELADIAIAGDGFELTIARAWLRWSPRDLLRGRLSIADLGAEGVRYRALPSESRDAQDDERAPFALPERVDLPVAVHVQRLSVVDIEAVAAVDAEPIAIERVLLRDASFADTELELTSLEIESPLLSAAGRATITAADDYPLDIQLEWRLRPPEYAELAGETVVGGSLAELVVEQRIAAPYGIASSARVQNALQPDATLTVMLDLDVQDLRLADIQSELPDATLSLAARIEGPLDALDAEVQASGIDPAQRRFVAELAATLTPESLTIRELAVRQPGRDGVLEGSGRIALAEETSADLSIRWDALQWPLTGEPVVVSPRGTLDFDGPLDGYRLSVDTRLEPSDAPPVDLRFSGEGDLSSIVLTLDAQEREGALAGRLDVVWSPSLRAEAALEAVNFDPSPFAADWPGAVNLAVEAAARVDGDELEVTVRRLDADGTLRGQLLALEAEGRFEQIGEQYLAEVERLRAELGGTRLEVSGRIAEQIDVEWRVDSDDLSSVLPQAAGQLAASGRITGPIPRVRIAASAEGRGLAFEEHRLSNLDVRADLDLGGEQASTLEVTARDALVANTAVGALVIEAAGTAGDHEVRMTIDAGPSRAVLRFDGRLQDPWADSFAWEVTLTEGDLTYASLAPWRLANPALITVDAEQLVLERQCWQAAEARLCLLGRRDAEALAVELELDDLGFDYLAELLPEGVDVRGNVNASAQASQVAGETLTAEVLVSLSSSELTLPVEDADEGTVTVRLEPSEIDLGLDATGARIAAALNLEHGRVNLEARTFLDAEVAADDSAGTATPLAAQRVAGRLEIVFPDLSFVSDLVPTLEEIEGRLGGHLDIAGTVATPSLSGTVQLENGAVFVPETGIALTDLQATLEGLGRDGIGLSAAAVSGGGELTVDGRLSLPGAPLDARLDIKGNAFQVVDNDEARVFLSPELRVEADAERLAVTGAVHVPRAELTPGEQPPTAVAVSADQVLLSDVPEAETPIERDLFAEIRVSLGNDVHFAGFGLTARIEGDLLVEQEPRTPTTATGELRILDGEYRAYGQGLVIDSGRIYFAGGPITQPALDVRAVRRPREGILVGANVRGTLESPSFDLFSEPSMTQQEQLSWLVLGRSLEEAPDGQENALSQAALAMGLRGSDFLARNIGERVGLDQFGIETGSGEAGAPSDPSDAALVVGKYLSPKLYVSYGIGLFTPESVLEMQYEISRNWTIVTQSSGEATGGDVLYTVEFGRK